MIDHISHIFKALYCSLKETYIGKTDYLWSVVPCPVY